MADGRATKIYMPSDISAAVSSLGLVSESLGIGDATPIDHTPRQVAKAGADDCCDDSNGRGGVDAAATTNRINAEITHYSRRMADRDDVNG